LKVLEGLNSWSLNPIPNRETRLGSQGFGVEISIYLIRMQGHPNSPALATLFDLVTPFNDNVS
jgi:hypothetical protein